MSIKELKQKTILVPEDFSEVSENSLDYAIELAKYINARIVLLHAYTSSLTEKSGENFAKEYETECKKLLSSANKIKRTGLIEYELVCKDGSLTNEIVEAAEETDADFIVMGTGAEGGLVKSILGSNTIKLMEKIKRPVLAVPEGMPFRKIGNITFTTDFKKTDLGILSNLLSIARPYTAQINILHVCDETQSAESEKEEMEKYVSKITEALDYNNLSFQIISGKDIEKELIDYVNEDRTDLLVMSTHHRSLFDRIFGHSISHDMVYHALIPTLIYHHNQDAAVKLISI